MRFTAPRKFTPQNPKKWINAENIIARSNLEMKYFFRCDSNEDILKIGSEEIVVPYLSAFDGKVHRYFPDLYLKIRSKSGKIKEFIVEIKPKVFTNAPNFPKSKKITKGYLIEVKNWIINQAKWEAANKFAEKNNMKFIIMTEKNL